MKKIVKVLFYAVAALYPVLVFTFLVVLKLPVRILSLCIVALAFAFFLSATGRARSADGKEKRSAKRNGRNDALRKDEVRENDAQMRGTKIGTAKGGALSFDWKPLAQSALFLAAGLFCFFTNRTVFLKLYSVAISATLLVVFGSTLFLPPNIIFRFACLQDKTIRGSAAESSIERYCRKVTLAWCVFFICNGSVSAFTAFFCSDTVWSVYNGGISYALMGCMFVVEFIIRRRVQRKMPEAHTISTFTADSRPDDFIVCYERKWSDGAYKTWRDFLSDSAKLRKFISEKSAQKYILHCEDYWYFLCAFIALLQCKKTVLLTQNVTREFIAEIKTDGVEFLTDRDIADSIFIPDVVENAASPSESDMRSFPKIEADNTDILLYTSGSTGKPKGVRQRMTEFELDNAFVFSKWGAEFAKRKLVTTVSQHHIYGFLFGIALPFGYGVPFRRTRIEYPEEFETLSDESYMIIATPAFLKRAVETERKLPLDNCFIFTSGGAVSKELAEKTEAVFGFCPLEVYGSTETSGIAYRQQTKDGLTWTPFDNAKIWKGEDGCLVIVSPYIKDPKGFATADLVDLLPDGRFVMKGRADSIVKIEEKRISMTEVENRLLQSGLVSDVKVVALEDVRQYLAAALVLNADGKRKFQNEKKLTINKFFHDYLMNYFENVVIPKRWRYVASLPCDVQGKKHKEDIAALFATRDASDAAVR